MRVELVALNAKFAHSSLALRYLKSYNKNYDIGLMEFSINDNIHKMYGKLIERNADVYGFSCYIWNIELTLKLAEMVKAALPDTIIILGGPEVGYCADKILNENLFADLVITGEGEKTFGEILAQLEMGRKIGGLSPIKGVTSRKISLIPRESMDLSEMPLPYTEEDIETLEGKIVYFETSRGCPFGCSYCLSSAERGVRSFSDEYIKRGLSLFFDKKVPLVKLIDRTFNYDSKRAEKILEFILENSKETCVHMEIEPRILTEEFLELLSKFPKGKIQLEMGIQSANPKTLSAIGRNFDEEKIVKNIKRIMAFGNIHIHLDLIAGLPYEDYKSFGKSFDFVYAMRPQMLQLGFLKLLAGTLISSDKNICAASFPSYEVISTKWMSAFDIIKLKKVEDAVEVFYNSGAFGETIEKLTRNCGFAKFEELGDFLYEIKENGNYKRKDLYSLLYKKYGENIRKELSLDFIINNKSIPLPEFTNPHRERGFKDKAYRLMKDANFQEKYGIEFDLKNLRFERIDGAGYMMDYKRKRLFNISEDILRLEERERIKEKER